MLRGLSILLLVVVGIAQEVYVEARVSKPSATSSRIILQTDAPSNYEPASIRARLWSALQQQTAALAALTAQANQHAAAYSPGMGRAFTSCTRHVVREGDTCASILENFNLTLVDLIIWNSGLSCAPGTALTVDRSVCVSAPRLVYTPPASPTPASTAAPVQTPQPTEAPQQTVAATPQPTQQLPPPPVAPPTPSPPAPVPPPGPDTPPAPTMQPTETPASPPPPPAPANPTAATKPAAANSCSTDFCCNMAIVGDGTVGGIASAAIACVPSAQNVDQAAILLIYMGSSLVALAGGFTGVLAGVPNDPNLLSPNALFFVASQTTSVTIMDSSFTNIANSVSPLITFEQGVNGVVERCSFQGNAGQLHGAVAVSSLMHVDIIDSQFISNTCTCGGSFAAPCGDSTCHNAAVYVTEGATSTISGCTFQGNTGHFGTALLVTSGGSFTVDSSTFTGNQVDVYGSFGAAIFFNRCGATSNGVATPSTGSITNCVFENNQTPGFGGAVAFDACTSISVGGSSFTGNTASLAGGAVFLSNTGGAGVPDGASTFADDAAGMCPTIAQSNAGFNLNAVSCM